VTKGKGKKKRAPWMERALILLMTPQRKLKKRKTGDTGGDD
jgi:hypothetical protein